MAAPQKNNSSRRAFEKQGFKLIREEPYYFKEIKILVLLKQIYSVIIEKNRTDIVSASDS